MTLTSAIQDSECNISRYDVIRAMGSWKRREFKYGDADCCSFIAHVTSELTGRDYRRFITYASESEAYGIIDSHGGFESLMDSVFENKGDPVDGDPCLVKLPIVGEMMGIKLDKTVVCITKFGLSQMPQRYIIRGWNLCHRH
jgi:hypothetical protein